MFETITSMIGVPGAVLAIIWVVLIGSLFLVTRGLSRSLAWAFVAGGLAIPAAVLQLWPMAAPNACSDTVLADGESADGRYAYRILKHKCRGSSELAYRVDLGRRNPATEQAALRPVMRSYGFPRPVAVRQVVDNHFLIYLTSDGREQVPLKISLDPETGEPSYMHRFFQGHSDRSFTVSRLSETSGAPPRPSSGKGEECDKGKRRVAGDLNPTVSAQPEAVPERSAASRQHSLRFRFTLHGLLPNG
ncbi:MAG: hypothetical protein ACLFWF_04655 [Alphaproteobacteria bacterium]